jgi:16S rRNA (guanine966-N2)-methyltransferase
MFAALGSLGHPVGDVVADLFAGSGALGIEALSRGAARAVFVESAPRAVAAIRENLAATGLGAAAEVLPGDVLAVLDRLPLPVDLAFCDPPYRFDRWAELLAALARNGVGLVVAESDRDVEVPDGWRLVRDKRYGVTVVRFLEPPAPFRPESDRP